MKLDAVVQDRNALLEMERYVDGGGNSDSALAAETEAAPGYRPESDATSFELVTVNAPTERAVVFKADPSPVSLTTSSASRPFFFPCTRKLSRIARSKASGNFMPCHAKRQFRVAPTASTRTVFVLPLVTALVLMAEYDEGRLQFQNPQKGILFSSASPAPRRRPRKPHLEWRLSMPAGPARTGSLPRSSRQHAQEHAVAAHEVMV